MNIRNSDEAIILAMPAIDRGGKNRESSERSFADLKLVFGEDFLELPYRQGSDTPASDGICCVSKGGKCIREVNLSHPAHKRSGGPCARRHPFCERHCTPFRASHWPPSLECRKGALTMVKVKMTSLPEYARDVVTGRRETARRAVTLTASTTENRPLCAKTL